MNNIEILLTGEKGELLFATPRARSSTLAAAVAARTLRGADHSRLGAVEFDGKQCVLVNLPLNQGTLTLVHPQEESLPALLDFIQTVDIAFDILNYFITNPYEGISVVDAQGILRYLSPVHEQFFGLAHGAGSGRPVQQIIENTRLHEVVKTGKAEIGQVQHLHNTVRVVNRLPIRRGHTVVGAIGQVKFKTPDEVHELSRQISRLRAEVDYYKSELVGLRLQTFGLDEIVGESAPIRQLKAAIRKVAPIDVPVLIVGESGTGKELVAHAIHNVSRRQERPMVLVNCGSLPEALVESELFGYEAGAFTGARRQGHVGKFEVADRSSMFLDEIGDMPVESQVKVLRVLETGVLERVGSNQQRKTNFRLISATNRDLSRLIAEGAFREDLYFRINGIKLHVPALRERPDDIPLLVQHYIERIAGRVGSTVSRIEPKAVQWLQSLPWPGNVRQLRNAVQRAIIFADGVELTLANFRDAEDLDLIDGESHADSVPPPGSTPATMREAVENVESTLIHEALTRHSGNKKRVAEELGISRSYLYKRLRAAP